MIQIVEIYTRDNCSFCERAKAVLKVRNIPFTEHKLDKDFTREQLLNLFPSAKTYPVVVVDGFNIGGYNELEKLLTEEAQDPRTLLNEGEGI